MNEAPESDQSGKERVRDYKHGTIADYLGDDSPPREIVPEIANTGDSRVDLIALSEQVILSECKWSSTRGYTMTLLIPEAEDGGHPLKEFGKGTRFHLVLVELDDGEEPINQALKKKLEDELKEANKGGRYSNYAGMLTKNKEFHRYLFTIGKINSEWDQQTKETMARVFILGMLHIKSRREIDHSEEARAAYTNLIADPFNAWRRTKLAFGMRAKDSS